MNRAKRTAKTSLLIRLLKANEGVAAVETAIVLPMLLWIMMAIIEMSLVFYTASLANMAINEAARKGITGNLYGATGSREDMIYSSLQDALGSWMDSPDDITLTMQSYGTIGDFSAAGVPTAGSGGNMVMYTATYNWKIFTPLFAQIVSGDGMFHITSRLILKNEDFD